MRARTAIVAAIAAAFVLSGAGAANASDVPIVSDNQVVIPVSLPVDICGISVAVLGSAWSGCQGGSAVAFAPSGAGGGAAGGEVPVLSGNQVWLPVSAPIQVCGIPVAILGSVRSRCGICRETNKGPGIQHHKHRKPVRSRKPVIRKITLPRTTEIVLSSGRLPTTGANLAGLAVGGAGLLSAGAGALVLGRRRQAER